MPRTTHQALYTHFSSLRDARDGAPVWLLEHGLDASELGALESRLRRELARTSARDLIWRDSRWLPLLVLCTEVGYQYRGTGTDYWPILGERIGRALTYEERSAIGGVFSRRCVELTGVSAPRTPWSRHFRIIAWPIAHAVLPAELRLKLLHALWTHPKPIVEETPADEIVSTLRRWALRYGPRLLTLAEQAPLAEAVVKALLERRSPARAVLGDAALARIVDDLRSDRAAMRDLRRVRRRQLTLVVREERLRRPPSGSGGPRGRKRVVPPPTFVPLLLRPRPTPSLHVRAPLLPDALRARALALTRASRRGAVRLWGRGRPVTIGNVLNGLEVPVSGALPEASSGDVGERVFMKLPRTLAADTQLTMLLESLRSSVARPLVFAGHTGPEGAALQVREPAVFGARTWYVLLDEDEAADLPRALDTEGVTELEQSVCGLRVYEVEAGVEPAQIWLRGAGVRVVPRGLVEAFALPTWDRPGDLAAGGLDLGDAVVLRVAGLAGESLSVGGQSGVTEDGLYLLTGAGSESGSTAHELRLGSVSESLTVSHRTPQEPAPLVSSTLMGSALTLEALDAGELSLRVEGVDAFEDLAVRVTLRGAGSASATAWHELSALPVTLGPTDALWDDVRKLLPDAVDGGSASLRLEVEVSGVGYDSWLLERSRVVSWVHAPERGHRVPVGETRDLVHSVLTPATPLPASGSPEASHEVRLRFALEDGVPILGSGLLESGASLSLGGLDVRRPASTSRRTEGRPGDLRDLLTGYLLWATAEADSLSRFARSRVSRTLEEWTVQGLCGSRWREAEAAMADAEGHPASAALDALVAAGHLDDEYARTPLEEHAGEERVGELFREELEREARRCGGLLSACIGFGEEWLEAGEVPDPKDLAELRRHLTDDFDDTLERLDDAACRAFERVRGLLEQQTARPVNEFLEPQMYSDREECLRTLAGFVAARREADELAPLRELIVPAAGRDELAKLDYSQDDETLLEAVVDWEARWFRSLLPPGPGRAEAWGEARVRLLYDVWQRPRRVTSSETLHAELPWLAGGRLTCRVVRYAVLRRRAALMGGR